MNGSARNSIDFYLPGILYASTVHAPIQLARPRRWNAATIRAMRAVIDIVELEHGIAVVSDTFEHVIQARNALEVKWS